MFAYPLVIFDLDGTLVDSVSDIAEALNLTLRQWELRPVEEASVRGWVGEGVRNLLVTALREQGREAALAQALPDMLRHYGACLLHRPQVYPGARETLAALRERGVALALCTNKPVRFVALLLEHLGLDGFFSALLGGDSLPERKPDPAPLRHLAARFGQPVTRCLMVGDSATDAAAARAAGMPLAMVRYGYLRGFDPAASGAIAVVDDLRELLALP
ncbi:MAG: phosphoglycolate phosphatase [Pseudomonas sp.]